jgi:hypothetical protein
MTDATMLENLANKIEGTWRLEIRRPNGDVYWTASDAELKEVIAALRDAASVSRPNQGGE